MVIGKLLMPTLPARSNKYMLAGKLKGKASISPEETLKKLGDKTCTIIMAARGIDTIGTTDLRLYKYILANYGSNIFGLPATNVFCIDKEWIFKISKAKDPDAIEFISKDYGIRSISKGRMELKSMKSGQSVNWILGHYFGLKGISFECLPVDPAISVGGMESSNMLIGAATIAGSVLSGANYDLGQIFYLATAFENDVHGGLTGGQGFAAGILGGSHAVEWAVHQGPFAGIATKLFGPKLYPEFEKHVSLLYPGREKSGRSSVDINEKWTKDALNQDGRKLQACLTDLSREAMLGYSGKSGIDWERVALAAQEQTDIRVISCPTFFAGIEDLIGKLIVKDGYKIRRGIARPGAGGYGTGIIVYSTTEELAEEAKNIIGKEIVPTEELSREIKTTGVMQPGWLGYKLSPEPINFEGFEEAGFENPARPVEINLPSDW